MVAARMLHRFEKTPAHVTEIGETFFRDSSPDLRDQTFVLYLVYGVIRFREQLDFVIGSFADIRDFRKQKLKASILRLGAFQLMPESKVPASAAIDETVKLARAMLGEGMTGFVNAVLRKIAGISNKWYELLPDGNEISDLTVRFSQPEWLIRQLLSDFGKEQTIEYLSGLSKRLRTAVRLNPIKCKREKLEKMFAKSGIVIDQSTVDDNYYLLPEKADISSFEPVAHGDCFVQNPSSGIVVSLTTPKCGWKVLDLCAAPGGKTAGIAAITGCPSDITAVDSNKARLRLMRENLHRLGLDDVTTIVADGTEFSQAGFNCVLVDAPCSGLGTISKHPEVKYIQSPENISELVERQYRLTENAARLIDKDGIIVYSVCTVTATETIEICRRFLENHTNFVLEVPSQFRYHHFVRDGMIRIPPGNDNLEGMFAFRARKTA